MGTHLTSWQLVDQLAHVTRVVHDHEPECCGFGGMFSVEENAVSVCMGRDKVRDHMATGAEYVTGPDSSCLMHMAGIAKKEKMPIKFIHVVQILAAGL